MMSIRYKIFGAFSVVVLLACAIAFYGIRAIGSAGDTVVRLYDGPLMGINHARSAHAALHEARLTLQRSLVAGASSGMVDKFEKLVRSSYDDLGVVRERAPSPSVAAARERVERELKDWSGAALKILKPSPGGVNEIPTSFLLAQQGDRLIASIDDLVELVAAYGYEYRTAAEAAVEQARTTMLSVALGTVAVGLIIALAFSYSMSRPISAAVRVAERVAAGNLTDDISVRRRDELGRLLKSLAVMQTSLKARADDDLALLAAKDQSTTEQTSRRQRLESEIDAFRSAFGTVLSNTDRITGELTDTAQNLASTARTAGTQSSQAASTAHETSTSVQTVASAAIQLGESVQAITSQLTDASAIVQRASSMAEAANQTIGRLATAAQQIDEVVGFIRTIAGQTNLLALNATIEAARAGEAGRGFAVVASEVKALATQTAKATEEISLQITDVQSATRQAVENVGAIALVIGDIDRFTGRIAAAVDHQNAAAAEISRNIGQAATGTALVARSIAGTAEATDNANRSADLVLATAHDLSNQAGQLRASVDRFIANVAA
ncbi:methyl-accepting chemotaxis protein [Bradyrhizobium centrosematis]|jgi:methyl-accepting chemotaxis protein|uniref:methyl-accepting chemotaxis protein n=1 Tax=Bradyrhizobium centrosematis TaxID=1300039 RepID=UPI002167ED33|nr:methyl-accepting chemotaxis protein [Bradyrhizobium centrosematis]MCS3761262.1 methyl-accepting chemotaxis protein [Bradyrhizobium centrosematis]MCS3770850.1 methyl-accepting chemotaxis protein [Bradyrhizobium centrosematis]